MNLKYIVEETSSPSTFKLIIEKHVLSGDEMVLSERAVGHCLKTDMDTVVGYARKFARNFVTPVSINEILYDIHVQHVADKCEMLFCCSE